MRKPPHERAHRDMVNVLQKYRNELTAAQLLSVVANVTGEVMAFAVPEGSEPQALENVAANIHAGCARARELMARKVKR